jgi:hypothetical protein
MRRDARLSVALFALFVAVYGGVYMLWLSGHQAAYLAITRLWGIDTWDWPFFDLQGVLSWAECRRLGVDVLKANPCDPMNRPFNYGPALLYLPFGIRQTTVLGLAQSTAFLAALCFVLRPRSRRGFVLAAAAGLSTAVLFALERGNLDLSEFALVTLACGLSAYGLSGRMASYVLYFLGGAIKFYPFALLLLVLRERTSRALAFAGGFALLIVCYAATYWKTLVAVAASMPKLGYDEDTFGGSLLGTGLADEFGWPESAALAISVLAFAAAGAFATWLAVALRRGGMHLDFAKADTRHLLAGAVIVSFCFLVQTNITYRCIFLLLMLPGLADLRTHAPTKALRRIFALAVAGLMFCLWSECLRRGVELGLDAVAPDRDDDSAWNDFLSVFFVGREIVWWSLIATAVSIVLAFLRDSPLCAAASSFLAGAKTRPAA